MLNLTRLPPAVARRPLPRPLADATRRVDQMSNRHRRRYRALAGAARAMTNSYDAIVIGAAHNGLVAATYLARAGWRTVVLERESRPGGAVLSDELTRPGLVHDVFATNMNLF